MSGESCNYLLRLLVLTHVAAETDRYLPLL